MRPYGRRKNRLRASGRVINSTSARVARGLMHTPIRNEMPSLFAHSRALHRTEIGGGGGSHLCVHAEKRQAGATCEVFHAVHRDDSGRGLSGCPGDKRPRLA